MPNAAAPAPPALSLVAKALVAAWSARHPGATPNAAGLALALAWSLGEGAWTSYFAGSNNFGSVHATRGFQATYGTTAGYGMIAFLDHGGAGAYVTRMAVYPSLVAGAGAFLALVEKDVDLSSVQTTTDFATGFYLHGYYEGFHTPVTPVSGRAAAAAAGTLTAADQQNIADGASLLAQHLPQAQAAFAAEPAETGDPSAATVGPPFDTLADRLTPAAAYAPHTLDHARTLLGGNADDPPAGAISIGDALAAPGGDGVWLFGPGGVQPSQAPAPTSSRTSSNVAGAIVGAAIATVTGLAIDGAWRAVRHGVGKGRRRASA